MDKFLFWKPFTYNNKARCEYCGGIPEFINTNPGFQCGYSACRWCVEVGPCTPHYHSMWTYQIGGMIYHINHGCHGIKESCGWCRAESRAVKRAREDEEYLPKPKAKKLKTRKTSPSANKSAPIRIIEIDCSDL